MGRDTSVVSQHAASGAAIRSIVSAESPFDRGAAGIRFAVNSSKLFLFDPSGGDRVTFTVREEAEK